MKKLLLLLCFFAGFSFIQAQEQNSDDAGFRAGFAAGYLSEIESVGGSVDLIYKLDQKWSIANTTLFTVNELPNKERLKWFSMDLNARYKVYDAFYMLAGGQFLYQTLIEKTYIGGFESGEQVVQNSNFGANIGAGYIYHLLSNVNVFTEIKYTILANESVPVESSGYMQARIGMVFDL
jgi:hypothetical protein